MSLSRPSGGSRNPETCRKTNIAWSRSVMNSVCRGDALVEHDGAHCESNASPPRFFFFQNESDLELAHSITDGYNYVTAILIQAEIRARAFYADSLSR